MKRTISVLLCIVMVISCMPAIAVQAGTNGIQQKLDEIRAVYPNDSYFTASGGPCTDDGGEDCSLRNIPSRGGLPSGASVANSTKNAYSCKGFARYVFYYMFGALETNCPTATSPLLGDFVEMNNNAHSAIYLWEDDSYYYVFNSNGDYKCGVEYNQRYDKNKWEITKTYHASNYAEVYGEHTCDFSEYLWYWAAHPHYSSYGCSICGAEQPDLTSSNYHESCLICNTPSQPSLKDMEEEYIAGRTLSFTWDETEHTTHYNLWLYRKTESGSWEKSERFPYVGSGFEWTATVGEYRAQLQAYNSAYWQEDHSDWLYSESEYYEFSVVELADVMPSKPSFKDLQAEYIIGEVIPFTWDETEHTTHYNFWLYRKNADGSWEAYEHSYYVENGFERTLELGEYRAQLQAYNSAHRFEDGADWLYVESEYFEFSVAETKTTLGDVNEDGELSSTDVVVLLKYLAGSGAEISEAAADMNGDGSISSADVVSMMMQFLK